MPAAADGCLQILHASCRNFSLTLSEVQFLQVLMATARAGLSWAKQKGEHHRIWETRSVCGTGSLWSYILDCCRLLGERPQTDPPRCSVPALSCPSGFHSPVLRTTRSRYTKFLWVQSHLLHFNKQHKQLEAEATRKQYKGNIFRGFRSCLLSNADFYSMTGLRQTPILNWC